MQIKRVFFAVQIAVAIALAVAACYGVIWFVRFRTTTVEDCLAQRATAEVLIRYLDRHQGTWPGGWDALEESFDIWRAEATGPIPFTLADLRERCSIEFSVSTQQFIDAQAQVPANIRLQVVLPRRGASNQCGEFEPNQLISNYLGREMKKPVGQRFNKRPPVAEERDARSALLLRGGGWELDDMGHVVTVKLASHPSASRFSDDALEGLERLSELRELNLSHSVFSDGAITYLRPLKSLRRLDLSGTQITDQGLAGLTGLDNLELLSVRETRITDQSLQHISRLRKLRVLNCSVTHVTDDGLKSLCGMTMLEELTLSETLVTPVGRKLLQACLPQVRIYQ